MKNTTQNKTNLTLKIGSFIAHALLASIAIVFTALLLIAINHAVLLLLANA